ncbi:hypothetical protein PP586_gp05 [Pseudoalteromonas phage vB_PspS-H40/1]|uniref:hypothetical protein n=1 Tax=Pseudoalteromonas phage vB_PspS-H40/1 TaxID=1856120 RepID=UPI0007DE12E1|nr:hypothetical protein PP586_gp05 [Pseudoalteromonas phage vB_PspS-H40/1]ANI22022.1 hypothetical protein H401_5 [Pseudoalteromonas phage vB_PspS-H40/1]
MRKYPLQAILQFDDPQSGNAAANVEFNVYNSGGGLATIYANDGANPISQTSPLVTDSNGRYDFYVDNGRYSILFTDPVVAAQNDVLDIGIYEYGSAGARDAATTAEAIAGTSNKLPDTIGVKSAINATGIGSSQAKTTLDWNNARTNGPFKSEKGIGQLNSPDDNYAGWQGYVSALNVDNVKQVVWVAGANAMEIYTRSFAGVWGDWFEIYHSGNLIHAQNLSGATVNSNAATSGANLSPAKIGTWRNVSGNDILNNAYGLWEAV